MLDEKQPTPFPSPPTSTTSTMQDVSHLDLEAGLAKDQVSSHDMDTDIDDTDPTPTPAAAASEKQTHPLTSTLSRTLSRIRTKDSLDVGPPPSGGWAAWR